MAYNQVQRCEARDYGDCYLHNELFDVTFKYRDGTGCHQPDEIVKVCMCKGHYDWLSDLKEKEKPLEMRGETLEYAIHDDLFSHLADKARMYTLMRVEFDYKETEQYHLFNGRDVEAMRKIIQTWYPNKDHYIRAYEVGFFQTTFHENAETEEYAEVIIEVKYISGELALEALANGLEHVHMMTPEGKLVPLTPSTLTWIPRTETDPRYAPEPMPVLFKRFFKKKQEAEIRGNFEECVDFIHGNIDIAIINWDKVRENSPHTEEALFETSRELTAALIMEGADTIMEVGDITPDVLWVTYVMANHRLFASHDPKKNLTQSKKLVELFIAQGLEKDLLTLAISGERERYLSRNMREHYDILYENEFVVEYLVPTYVSGDAIIYKTVHDEHTPLTYWNAYDNTTIHLGGRTMTDTFEKNEKIRLHLELHTTTREPFIEADEQHVFAQPTIMV
jgi:hypothetical protein